MEKPWIKNYHNGVPAEINTDQYHSIVEMLLTSCEKHRDAVAFKNFGAELTYGEWDKLSREFAAYLQNELQLSKGDRVAIMMPNLLQYPVAMLGILRAGLIVANVNPLYTPAELTHLLNDSGAKAIVIMENFAHVLAESLPQTQVKHVIVTQLGDLFPGAKSWMANFVVKYIKKLVPSWHIDNAIKFNDVLAKGEKLTLNPVNIEHDDVAYLQYTGGTTGVSKGTMLTHNNLIANVIQLTSWVMPTVEEDKVEKEIAITPLPLYHIFSLTVNLLTYATMGGMNILITNPRDIPQFVKEIKDIPFTVIGGVNTLFNALLNHPEFQHCDFTRVRICFAGGMAVQHAVAERWQKVTGAPIIEGYGLTETSPVVTANPLDIDTYTGSIGLPLPSTDVTILDENGKELPIGEHGELCIKGPQVMKGYWNNGQETSKCFTEDGWLRTGDVAYVNEHGYFYLVDRKKDMIIVSGFNVYPNEVEDVIAEHPGVSEVAVIGVPSERSGEIVKAFIVKKDPNLSEKDIIEFCHESLTRYKVPKEVEFRDELPKTNVGKILRRALRE